MTEEASVPSTKSCVSEPGLNSCLSNRPSILALSGKRKDSEKERKKHGYPLNDSVASGLTVAPRLLEV